MVQTHLASRVHPTRRARPTGAGSARKPKEPDMSAFPKALLGAGAVGFAIATSAGGAQAQDGLPAVTGPSPVGRTEMALTDASRTDPFTEDDRARELAVWIWYPAVAGSTRATAPYLPPIWADLANAAGVVSTDLHAVRANAIQDAPLDGRPPVVVLMPGLGQPVAAYTALAEDLASHGYAVVG